MRIARLLSIPLFATAAVSCADGADSSPTAPHAHAGNRVETMASSGIVLPAPGGFSSQVLARGSFTDAIDATFRIKPNGGPTQVVHVDDPTQMVMARITIAAGGALPWHTHPGPALVTVAAGELTVIDGHDCEARRYVAGASFMDSGQGHVHTAFNPGTVEMVLYVTYLDVPVGASPLVPVAAPSC